MVKEQIFLSDRGEQVRVPVPDPADRPSVFFLAGHKTGSSLLYKLVTDICKAAALPEVAVEHATFLAGVPVIDWPDGITDLLEHDGYVFTNFRFFEGPTRAKNFWDRKKVVLIRDPRDCVCSLYFSSKSSHVIPKSGSARDMMTEYRSILENLSINDFVLRGECDWSLRNYNKILTLVDRSDVVLYRYENVVFDKTRWINALCRELDVTLPSEQVAQIAEKHDIVPKVENPQQHVRRVTPGDYRNKLSPEAIAYVEAKCSGYFTKELYCANSNRFMRAYSIGKRLIHRAVKGRSYFDRYPVS